MTTKFRIALMTVPVMLLAAAAQAAETAEVVYERVHPSVVGLRNPEGSGTGIVLDANGLILTNAHVVMSPLPYQATIDIKRDGKLETVKYGRATLLGVHPEYDLALVRVDPKEHPGALVPATLSKQKPRPGQSVFAIGNPGAGDGLVLAKTITNGMLSAAEREIEGLTYHQFSAPINPGNSGGPLCNADGQVVGLVTFKMNNVEGIGFAIPLDTLDLKQFVPQSKRKSDPEQAKELIAMGDRYMEQIKTIRSRVGADHPQLIFLRSMALRAYWYALMNMPDNAGLYYNVGMIYRTLNEDEMAVAYLVRAIEMQPWGDERGDFFRELGVALAKLGQTDAAMTTFEEGLAKQPGAGKIWEDVAVTHSNASQWEEAAYAAKAAMHCGDSRRDVMQSTYNTAVGKLDAQQRAKLDQRVQSIPLHLGQSRQAAEQAKAQNKKHLTEAFGTLLASLSTAPSAGELEAARAAAVRTSGGPGAPAATALRPDAAPAPAPAPKKPDKPEKTPEQIIEDHIKEKLELAQIFQRSKLNDKAREVLDGIISEYPKHPLTAKARELRKKL